MCWQYVTKIMPTLGLAKLGRGFFLAKGHRPHTHTLLSLSSLVDSVQLDRAWQVLKMQSELNSHLKECITVISPSPSSVRYPEWHLASKLNTDCTMTIVIAGQAGVSGVSSFYEPLLAGSHAPSYANRDSVKCASEPQFGGQKRRQRTSSAN